MSYLNARFLKLYGAKDRVVIVLRNRNWAIKKAKNKRVKPFQFVMGLLVGISVPHIGSCGVKVCYDHDGADDNISSKGSEAWVLLFRYVGAIFIERLPAWILWSGLLGTRVGYAVKEGLAMWLAGILISKIQTITLSMPTKKRLPTTTAFVVRREWIRWAHIMIQSLKAAHRYLGLVGTTVQWVLATKIILMIQEF